MKSSSYAIATGPGYWRTPTLADRQKTCVARNPFEGPFKVVWSAHYKCWAFAEVPHVLVLVSEIFEPS